MSRRRKAIWFGSILLVLAAGIGGYYRYWQSHAIDRKVCQLVYEEVGYPDTKTERIFKRLKLDLLLNEKPKSRDGDVAIKELLALGTEATPGLISMLDDGNDDVRLVAVYYLKDIGDVRAVEPLIRVLKEDPNDRVRRFAIESLFKLDPPKAVELT